MMSSSFLRHISFFGLAVSVLLLASDCSTKRDSAMRLDGEWFFKVDSLERGMEERWFVERADRSDWSEVVVPEHWDRYDLEEYDGVGWFATTFEIEDLSKPLALFFGGVDDDAEVWVNGKSIGTHIGYSEPFFLE